MPNAKVQIQIANYIGGFLLVCGLIYGTYWVFKTVSYTVFYEDMVIETIHKTVKPQYLIK
jgi:hypothetical protein